MKRLVYSPSINAWIKTSTGVFDLSPYITDFTIDRRVNEVSVAQISFRNPKIPDSNRKSGQRFLFTEHPSVLNGSTSYEPMFHPMDPIIITLTRLKGKPIQVFTGYCDTTPYVQLYPGIATLTASCTLKRLQYTYWDPALPFLREFLGKYGWAVSPSGTAFNQVPENTGELNDSSIGFILYKVLEEIGGWQPENIYIQALPGGQIGQIVAKLFDDVAKENASSIEEFKGFMQKIIGAAQYGSAGGAGGESGDTNFNTPGTGLPARTEGERVRTIRSVANSYQIPPEFVLAVALVETDLSGEDYMDKVGWYQWQSSQSYVGKPPLDMSKARDLSYSTGRFCQAAKVRAQWKDAGASRAGWARSIQLNPSSINGVISSDLGPYVTGIPTNNARYSDAQFPGFVNRAKELLRKYPD